jgi:membrane protease YdiL (CAAX protease family)
MMLSKRNFMKYTVRPIGLAFVFISFGSFLALLLGMLLDIEIPILTTSGITFIFAAFAAFVLFPRILKIPFGDIGLSEYLHRLGFYLPQNAWKHIILGILLAVCTISGMLIASLLTGRYELDWSTVNSTHILFSVNPGLWEEFFYRGVIMFVLLTTTRSIKQAAIIQVILFGLAHIKGVDIWSWFDVITVTLLAISFTYTAFKTRALITCIVFHFIHDALLFLPQLPRDEQMSTSENLLFYGCLWLMVGVGFLLVKIASDNFGVKAAEELYSLEKVQS